LSKNLRLVKITWDQEAKIGNTRNLGRNASKMEAKEIFNSAENWKQTNKRLSADQT